jgi:hypothetical protein
VDFLSSGCSQIKFNHKKKSIQKTSTKAKLNFIQIVQPRVHSQVTDNFFHLGHLSYWISTKRATCHLGRLLIWLLDRTPQMIPQVTGYIIRWVSLVTIPWTSLVTSQNSPNDTYQPDFQYQFQNLMNSSIPHDSQTSFHAPPRKCRNRSCLPNFAILELRTIPKVR